MKMYNFNILLEQQQQNNLKFPGYNHIEDMTLVSFIMFKLLCMSLKPKDNQLLIAKDQRKRQILTTEKLKMVMFGLFTRRTL